MDVKEVEDLLHFGAQRGGHDYPQSNTDVKFSGILGSGSRGISFGSPSKINSAVETSEQRRIKLENEIREKTIELDSLNDCSPWQLPSSSNAPTRMEGKGFSMQQITEIVQLFQALQASSGCSATERVSEQRLVDIAPRFDLKDPIASWKAFEVFFDINRVVKDETKFTILNGKLPWETMRQFGKENPNSGGDLKKLEVFLKAYSKQSAPSMYHREAIGKYGYGSLLRDVLHEAKSMADLDRNERIKLNAYFLSTGNNRKLIESNMHLPVETFFSKVSQKWNECAPPPFDRFNGRTLPPRHYREYKNQSYNNYNYREQGMNSNFRKNSKRGFDNGRFDRNASSTVARNGEISGMGAEPQDARLLQDVVIFPNEEPQQTDVSPNAKPQGN